MASFTVYQLHHLVSSTSSISVSGVRPSPWSLPRLPYDPCAFFDAPTLPISGILVATR